MERLRQDHEAQLARVRAEAEARVTEAAEIKAQAAAAAQKSAHIVHQQNSAVEANATAALVVAQHAEFHTALVHAQRTTQRDEQRQQMLLEVSVALSCIATVCTVLGVTVCNPALYWHRPIRSGRR
jgi:hypothetical protein